MFNKKAFYNKIHKKPDLVPHEKVTTKYKHNENVLHSTPVKFRQVTVPSPAINEYITGTFLYTYVLYTKQDITDIFDKFKYKIKCKNVRNFICTLYIYLN